MQIKENAVVTMEYELKNEKGDLLDTSKDHGPIAYIHGIGNLVQGLEKALDGKAEGDVVEVTVSPEEGYGLRDDALVQTVARSLLAQVENLEEGMPLEAETPEGIQVVYVSKIADDEVEIDGNHPLAGEVLNFKVEILGVREASDEELDHGHVHGEHGHHH